MKTIPSMYPASFGKNIVPKTQVPAGQAPEPVVLQPLTQFPGDINIPANTTVNIPIQTLLGGACVGFALLNITANVFISINGGGLRTVNNNMSMDGCQIQTLSVNGGLNGCVCQLIGV